METSSVDRADKIEKQDTLGCSWRSGLLPTLTDGHKRLRRRSKEASGIAMKTIKPLFPDQQIINDKLQLLSPEARADYNNLLKSYEEEISKSTPDHTIISDLISRASEILKNGYC